MSEDGTSAEGKPCWTRDEIIGTIGEAILDARGQFPPFPAVRPELAWVVAEEIYARLCALDVVKGMPL
jgi:hypothetical protein